MGERRRLENGGETSTKIGRGAHCETNRNREARPNILSWWMETKRKSKGGRKLDKIFRSSRVIITRMEILHGSFSLFAPRDCSCVWIKGGIVRNEGEIQLRSRSI